MGQETAIEKESNNEFKITQEDVHQELGVKLSDAVDLFIRSRMIFKKFPQLTDEQFRGYLAGPSYIKQTNEKMYIVCTRRSTSNQQFSEIVKGYHETVEQLVQDKREEFEKAQQAN